MNEFVAGSLRTEESFVWIKKTKLGIWVYTVIFIVDKIAVIEEGGNDVI